MRPMRVRDDGRASRNRERVKALGKGEGGGDDERTHHWPRGLA